MSVKTNIVKQSNSGKMIFEMKSQTNELIYLYCITAQVPKLKDVQNLADNLYFICEDGLYAVISKVSCEFNEENLKKNLADLEWIKNKAGRHENIIEGVMEHTCVLPFKLATLFNTEDNLRIMLNKYSEVLKDNLDNLKDKEEWGVKIYCDMERLNEAIKQEDEGILNIEKEIKNSLPGKAFILRKKKEQCLKDIINKRINEYGKECFELLKAFAQDVRINKLLPKEVTERKDEMILNSSYLVAKFRINAFIDTIGAIRKEYENEGLFFDCSGPWPAYNFCQMKV